MADSRKTNMHPTGVYPLRLLGKVCGWVCGEMGAVQPYIGTAMRASGRMYVRGCLRPHVWPG
jgi:hypothetical protein